MSCSASETNNNDEENNILKGIMGINTDQFVMVDDNIGISNRVEKESIDTVLTDTFKDIANVLMDHCGPYGQFAMLAKTGVQVAEPVFTKDGIGIVRAMQYASPVQEFIRNTMAYMGSRIETAAGDGTTSSMVLLANGIVKLRKKIAKIGTKYTFSELQSSYRKFVEITSRLIKENSFTIDGMHRSSSAASIKDLVWNVAYSQAWTSTHGNADLSKAIADLFANNPREAWNYLLIEKSKIENDKLYYVEKDNSQYSIQNVTIWPESAKTEDLGISRIRDNARTILSSVAPGHDTYEGEELLKQIDKALENKEQLTIVCYRGIDSQTQAALTDKFRQHQDHDVCLFLINDDDPRLNDITCMKALANQMEVLVEKNLSYRYEKGDLTIVSGLYALDKDVSINPYLGDESHKALNDLVSHLDKVINQIKSEVSNRRLNDEMRRLKKFRLKLTVVNRSYFKIGGAAYDNAAAVDVVLDAILATKHSLENGFGYGGNKMLYTALSIFGYNLRTKEVVVNNKCRPLIDAFISTFKECIYEQHLYMLNVLAKKEIKKLHSFYFTRSIDLTDINPSKLSNTVGTAVSMNAVMKPSTEFTTPLIVQPIDTDIEFIKRFGELALKFIYTNRIIVDGGMCGNRSK